MSPHVFAPRRPHGAPVAGTIVSLAVHAAFVIATVARTGLPAPAEVPPPPRAGGGGQGGERLLWIGIAPGAAADPARVRPGERPPTAYVVPGSGTARTAGGGTRGDGRSGDARGAGDDATPPPPAAERPTEAPAAPARRAPRPVALPAMPDVALGDPAATVLVAGVLSAAPDLSRRASRPEDFARPADDDDRPISEVLARAEVRTTLALRSVTRVDVLPVPLVSNPLPAYPTTLERAQVGGQVVVEFRIDSAGTVDLGTLQVVRSTNAAFTQAVEHVLPLMRFVPAQLGQQAVGVRVRQPFLFVAGRR